MKKLFLVLIAGFALVTAHDFNRVYAGDDGGGGIPLSKLAGKYAETYPPAPASSFYLCFKPDFSATENCFTKGAVPLSLILATIGQKTQDKDGNSCIKLTGTLAFSAPLAFLPPTVNVEFGADKVTKYDPATASGDVSFTNYTGGKCVGSKFDSTGATKGQTGTYHFVASDNGERTDFVTTTFIDALGDIGAFAIPGVDLKQK
jgi:hypothetical protein